MATDVKAPYVPDYASYNWIGAPSNYSLSTNPDLGGNSSMLPSVLVSSLLSSLSIIAKRGLISQGPRI